MTDDLEVALLSLRGVFDGDEVVDEFSHALQCAMNARHAGVPTDLVTAALFHDIARSPVVADAFPGVTHEAAAAMWLAPRFGDRVAWLAGAHVAAKLYLLATEPDYAARVSPESTKSARHQGDAPTSALLDHPWWDEAVQLRRWDDAAKDPNAALVDLSELLALVDALRVS